VYVLYAVATVVPTALSLSYQLSRLKLGSILWYINQRVTTAERARDAQSTDKVVLSPAACVADVDNTERRQTDLNENQNSVNSDVAKYDRDDHACKYMYTAAAVPVLESKKNM
jgi:hypothetical protein